jgi:DNA invertase Pin-like site-specific DNA recombinase
VKTCILYARVSTTRQAHEYGLEAQLDNCRPWAEREGYMVLDEIADTGGDDSKRDVLNRPGLRRILEMVSERKVDAIIAVDRDRYGEHPVPDQLAGLLAASGTQMRALDDAGEGEDAEFLNGIKDLWARQERRKIAKRSRRGKLRKAREGKVLALGQPNFGYVYTVDRDGYVVDEEHMKLMRRIFKMLGPDGLSIHETRKTLDREGWPTPSRVWSECIAEERERKGLDPKPFSEKWSQPFIREAVRDDCYKMFTAEEVGELVLKGRMKPDVAARVEAPIGVWWYVGTDYDGNECRVAVPVPPSGVPREWLELPPASRGNGWRWRGGASSRTSAPWRRAEAARGSFRAACSCAAGRGRTASRAGGPCNPTRSTGRRATAAATTTTAAPGGGITARRSATTDSRTAPSR